LMELINEFRLGDCIEQAYSIEDHSINLMLTDPPYYIMNKQNITFKNRSPIVLNAKFDHFKSYAEYIRFIDTWLSAYYPKLKENSRMIVFFAVQYNTDLIRIAKKGGFEFEAVWGWRKPNPAPKIFKKGFLSCMEYAIFLKKGNPTFNFLSQSLMHNCFEYPLLSNEEKVKDEKGEGVHPTQKPIAILEHLLKIASNPYDLVVDPFGGVASTNVACANLTRHCVSFEKDPTFHFYGSKRIETKKKKANINQRQKSIIEF